MRARYGAREIVVAAMIGALAMGPASALADERVNASLTYAPDADIERCPTAPELKDAVAARVGYDPFDGARAPGPDAARREVVVAVHRRGAGIVGVLELRGPRPGTRELVSPNGDCRELLDALAVAIAIGIDPASLTRPPGEPPPPAAAPPSPSPAPVPAPAPLGSAPPPEADRAPAAPPKEPVEVKLGAGPVVLFGELPATAPAIAVGLGVRWKWLEPTVEGIGTLPVALDARGGQGRVTASLIAAALVPCGHADVFFGCVGVTFGALRGEGELVGSARRGSQFYSGASGRAGAELAISRTVWVRAYAEAVAALTHIALQLAAQDVWRVPSVAARVGATAGIRF
jgi:hypothetical protein